MADDGPPPLYRDTLALSGVLFEELEDQPRHPQLCRALREDALFVLGEVSAALAGRDQRLHLDRADAALHRLRAELQLALELELLDEDAYLDLAEHADAIGRQIGGLLRAVARRRQE